jgi:hypothetical protein
MTHRRAALATLLCAGLGLAAADTATAVTTTRTVGQLANGLCGANNPANDPNLRRLPTGLKNAGTTTVSVVCAQWADDTTAAVANSVVVYFKNDKTVGANVSCTLSMGVPYYGQVASTRSVYVAAGGTANILWDADQYGTNANQQWVNLQCSVPSAFTMREIFFSYDEDVGL